MDPVPVPLALVGKMPREVDRLAIASMAQHDLGRAREAGEALEALTAKADSAAGDVAYGLAMVPRLAPGARHRLCLAGARLCPARPQASLAQD